MNFKWLFFTIGLGLLSRFSAALVIDWDGLPDLVAKSPAEVASQNQISAAQARRGFMRRSFQPQLNVGVAGVAGAGTTQGAYLPQSNSTSTWLETSGALGMNLWRGNQDRHRDETIEAEAKSAFEEAARDRAQRLADARKAWLAAWKENRILEIIAKVSLQSKEDRQRAQKKASAGLTSQTDVMEFDLRLQELDLETIQAQESRDLALSRLGTLVAAASSGIDLGAGVNLWPSAGGSPSPTSGQDEKILNLESQARRGQAQALGTWPYPSLDAGLRGLLGGPDTSLAGAQGYEARLGLSLALWGSSQAGAERDFLKFQSQALSASAEGVKRERNIALEFSQRRLSRWTGMASPLEERLALAEKLREKVSGEYARGVRDARDLESATNAVLNASTALVEAKIAAWEAWSELERLQAVSGSRNDSGEKNGGK